MEDWKNVLGAVLHGTGAAIGSDPGSVKLPDVPVNVEFTQESKNLIWGVVGVLSLTALAVVVIAKRKK